ncbi:amino acid adenylation domain-containing protein [Pseudoalteromonas sp. ASV78]|uniref:amino acid adenylation domain-containing protein n=1 Tax=Pseudoalteromonas sp. ASV78 TaxID=3397851 RepID=UPI0039FD5967
MSNNAASNLTSVQRDVYINQKIYADLPLTNAAFCIEITGQLNELVFKEAFKLTIKYSDTFLSHIQDDNTAEPKVIYKEHIVREMEYVDYSTRNESRAVIESQIKEWSETYIRTSVTKIDSPLYKGTLVKKSDGDYQFWLVLSHVICDGMGSAIFTKNMYQIYDALLSDDVSGNIARIKGNTPSFRNQSFQEAEYLASEKFEGDRSYWKQRLDNLSAQTVVSRYSYQFSDKDIVPSRVKRKPIDRQAFEEIATLAKKHRVSINQVMQAAIYVCLLNSYDAKELVVGQVFHNRRTPIAKKTVGMFTKSLPARYNFGTSLTFAQLLQNIKEVNLADRPHTEIPLDQIAQDIDIYGQGRTVMFDLLFNHILMSFDNHPQGTKTLTNYITLGYDHNPLNISLIEFGKQQDLEVSVEHNLEYYNDEEAIMLIERLTDLVLSLPKHIDTLVKDIDILSESDRKFIQHYNDTFKAYKDNPCMHELFIQQAQLTPEHIALYDGQGKLSYQQLLGEIVGASHLLPNLSSSERKPIGIYMPKDRTQLISAMAIMCNGHFYIPLETHWPSDRVNKVIEKARIDTVVSLEQWSTNFPDSINCILAEDFIKKEPSSVWLEQVATCSSADALAYVIFTSGSTGEPKGVAIAHKGAVNTVRDINQRFSVSTDDRILAVSDLSFDLNVYDFFGILATGGAVVFPTASKEREPGHWAELIEKHNVSIWNTVPASAELLVSYFELNNKVSNAPIRHMMLSGDWLPPKLPHRLEQCFQASGRSTKVHSFGGATEASIWSITYPIEHDCSNWKSVPYGRPMLNQSFYVLNKNQKLLPVGYEGELYIGGIGVAECYFNDIDKTNHSYIQHPQLNQRLYRTGDLGRLMTNGNIEFIGRVDHQVKINGFRIELGEIESYLNSLLEIKDAICQVMENQQGTKVINAYIVAINSDAELSIIESLCRAHLQKKVPRYMLPVNYFLLENIPLTSNGKVDRKALPTKENDLEELQQASTEIEIFLADIWCQEIGIESLGTQQSLYELGGASLNAIRIIMQINNIYPQLELQLRDMMQYYTVASLATFIEQKLMYETTGKQESVEELEW